MHHNSRPEASGSDWPAHPGRPGSSAGILLIQASDWTPSSIWRLSSKPQNQERTQLSTESVKVTGWRRRAGLGWNVPYWAGPPPSVRAVGAARLTKTSRRCSSSPSAALHQTATSSRWRISGPSESLHILSLFIPRIGPRFRPGTRRPLFLLRLGVLVHRANTGAMD